MAYQTCTGVVLTVAAVSQEEAKLGDKQGEHTFECGKFTGTTGLEIWLDLKSALGPSLASGVQGMISGVGNKDGAAGILNMKIGAGFFANVLMTSIDRDKVVPLVKRIVKESGLLMDGKPVDKTFDVAFQGRQVLMLKAIGFVLQVNYDDFFDLLTSAFGITKA